MPQAHDGPVSGISLHATGIVIVGKIKELYGSIIRINYLWNLR